jgi:adenylosuccinate synthase
MTNTIVLGTQWGDEGKGKIIDLLAPSFDMVARYQGGHNAGHTVYVDGKKIILHCLPSGILHPGKLCVIGNGVVLEPKALLQEIAMLKSLGISVENRLLISKNTHLILPYHTIVEKISEELDGERKIGTTSRGIGPAYKDKASRHGIRAADLLNPELLRNKIERNVKEKNVILSFFGQKGLDAAEVFKEFAEYASQIKDYIADVSMILSEEIALGKSLLIEGAQGTLLDIDHGTYPFVTSSSSTAGGACTGLGLGPDKINFILGVTKAYTTRVGEGPFPTEISDKTGQFLLEKGNEFGATTGRPRRCGWFDSVAVSYACRINGVNKIVLTKSDILDGLEKIKVCTAYRYKNSVLKNFPTEEWVLAEVKPEYRAFDGWDKPVSGAKTFDELPQAFKDYVSFLEESIGAEVAIISTGKERGDTIFLESRLKDIIP